MIVGHIKKFAVTAERINDGSANMIAWRCESMASMDLLTQEIINVSIVAGDIHKVAVITQGFWMSCVILEGVHDSVAMVGPNDLGHDPLIRNV